MYSVKGQRNKMTGSTSTRIILSRSYNLKGCYVFVERGGKHTLDRADFVSIVGEGGEKKGTKNKHGAAMRRSGCLDRSVVGIVEGKCRGSYGIRWRVTSGGIARGSSAVAIGVGVCRTASDGDGYWCRSDSWWRWSYCSQTALGSGTVG